MEYTLTESEFIVGIGRGTLRRAIANDWLDAYKSKGGRWLIEGGELCDYAYAKWGEGRVLMNRPETWAGRMEHLNDLRRVKARQANKAKGGKTAGAAKPAANHRGKGERKS